MTERNRYGFRVTPGMRRGLRSAVPIPTQLVSNEEFPPIPQTAAQRRVEDRILAEAARMAPRLGVSRRQFLGQGTGMAATLLAMNAVFGRFFDVLPVEAAEPAAFQERSGPPVFIFDVQLTTSARATTRQTPRQAAGERSRKVPCSDCGEARAG